jgi:hypothetical protein
MATPTTAERWQVHEQRYQRMLAPFTDHPLKAAALARADRVLDIGCGTGSATRTARDLAGNEWIAAAAQHIAHRRRLVGIRSVARHRAPPQRAEGNP